MKLLINICSHDGIVSHYNGVGTMTTRYIKTFTKICEDMKIDYDLNLFTPEYAEDSFGYNASVYKEHKNMPNTKIYQIDNGSNKKVNFGTTDNWKVLCENTAKIINKIDKTKYDKVLTICNDTPFCCLINKLECSDNHIKVLILHSSIKIHQVDSAIEGSEKQYNDRLNWELEGINYINKEKNSYLGSICKYFENHLIKEYGLKKNKVLNIYNGELLYETKKPKYSEESKKLFKELENKESLIIAFGRAEEYKNLDKCFELGHALNITSIVVAQLYYKGQPIQKDLEKQAKKYNGILYIDPPFDLPKYILNTFKGKIICLVPSKKEIMGLIINETRKFKRDNILVVSNNIGGLSEQIKTGYDGILVNLDNIEEAKEIISKYFNEKDIKRMSKNSIKTLEDKYDFYKISKNFIEKIVKI